MSARFPWLIMDWVGSVRTLQDEICAGKAILSAEGWDPHSRSASDALPAETAAVGLNHLPAAFVQGLGRSGLTLECLCYRSVENVRRSRSCLKGAQSDMAARRSGRCPKRSGREPRRISTVHCGAPENRKFSGSRQAIRQRSCSTMLKKKGPTSPVKLSR